MERPALLNDGDDVEKATWPHLVDFFPHYEVFWQTHIVPLRNPDSIYPRRGIDEDFEFLAMRHYSTYVNLADAYERVLGGRREDRLRFPDDIYASLHRAADLALEVVKGFKHICETCLHRKEKVDTSSIESLMTRISVYRNLIHEEFPAIRVDADGRRHIPCPEKLGEYRKWTDVLYNARSEDFVDVGTQLVNDFRALSSAIETSWKTMCELSGPLVADQEYLRKRGKGDSLRFYSALSTPISSSVVSTIIIREPNK
jgi:hypothetical protein